MCTAIAKKGTDILYGFNLDIDPAAWRFDLYKTKNVFSVGITVGRTTYYTHGVSRLGHFGCVPYMNGERFPVPKGLRRERIDLMVDRFLRGKYSFADVDEILKAKALTNIPAATLHALLGDRAGNFRIAEPGYGCRVVEENYAVLTNFPVLTALPDDENPFYGKDRYDKALSVLQSSGDDFSISDALGLLSSVCQGGQWATRVSFVYSVNENAVYYFLNGDDSHIEKHAFTP